jgi:hypothetical protein
VSMIAIAASCRRKRHAALGFLRLARKRTLRE